MSRLQVRNEALVDAPVEKIWALITDIGSLHRVNPGIVTATGRMDTLDETRTCEINNSGRKGTMVERLIELVPQSRTVWTIESDTMGMRKMLHDTRFIFNLERLDAQHTKVVSETHYEPATLLARIMNGLMIKRNIAKAQAQILDNIKNITEK